MANPLDHEAIVDVQFASSRDVRPVVACRSEILVGLERHYPPPPPPRPEVVEPESENAPAVQMLNQIVLDAIKWRASDIHIEPVRATCTCGCASMACCATTSSFHAGCGASERRAARDAGRTRIGASERGDGGLDDDDRSPTSVGAAGLQLPA